MKIKIEKNNIEKLKELNNKITNLLKKYPGEVEFTEENFNEIKELVDEVNFLGKSILGFSKVHIKIVSSGGIELTTI